MNLGWVVAGAVGSTGVVGLVGVLFFVGNFDAEPGVVRVMRAVVDSRRKTRFMPLS
jgi:hypothetical protein